MKVFYIAGPFTAETAWKREQNIRRAEEIALGLATIGIMPLCPHTNTRFFDGECTPDFWYEGTLELLRRCDAVVMVPGWEASRGAVAECNEAMRLGKPVYYNLYEIVRDNVAALLEEQKNAENK